MKYQQLAIARQYSNTIDQSQITATMEDTLTSARISIFLCLLIDP